jgi:hypothetical protein
MISNDFDNLSEDDGRELEGVPAKKPGQQLPADCREYRKKIAVFSENGVLVDWCKKEEPPGEAKTKAAEFAKFLPTDQAIVMAAIRKLVWPAEEGFGPGRGFLYEEKNYNLFLKNYMQDDEDGRTFMEKGFREIWGEGHYMQVNYGLYLL